MIDVRPCSSDDHVDWLLQNGLFKKALEFTKLNAHSLEKFSAVEVGKEYLEDLMANQRFQEAAEMLTKVVFNSSSRFETSSYTGSRYIVISRTLVVDVSN